MIEPVTYDPIFKIFPIPVTEKLNVHIQRGSVKDLKYFVFDEAGRVLMRGKHTCEQECQFHLDVHHLSPGKYIFIIYAGNGIYRAAFVKMGW